MLNFCHSEIQCFYSECFISKQSGAQLHLQGGNGRGIFTEHNWRGYNWEYGAPDTPENDYNEHWRRTLGGYCAIHINISSYHHIRKQHFAILLKHLTTVFQFYIWAIDAGYVCQCIHKLVLIVKQQNGKIPKW